MASSRILYHVCRASMIDSIMQNGLNPSYSKSSLEAIFLADLPEVAEGYVMFDPEVDWILLAVESAHLDKSQLGPDNYELPDMLDGLGEEELEMLDLYEGIEWHQISWKDSLVICNQVAYYATIDPQYISIIKQIDAPNEQKRMTL